MKLSPAPTVSTTVDRRRGLVSALAAEIGLRAGAAPRHHHEARAPARPSAAADSLGGVPG